VKLAQLESICRNLPVTSVRQIPFLVQEAPVQASANAIRGLQVRMGALANNAIQESTKRPQEVVDAISAQNIQLRCLGIQQCQIACVCLDMPSETKNRALHA
jgi:hypothetical protein